MEDIIARENNFTHRSPSGILGRRRLQRFDPAHLTQAENRSQQKIARLVETKADRSGPSVQTKLRCNPKISFSRPPLAFKLRFRPFTSLFDLPNLG